MIFVLRVHCTCSCTHHGRCNSLSISLFLDHLHIFHFIASPNTHTQYKRQMEEKDPIGSRQRPMRDKMKGKSKYINHIQMLSTSQTKKSSAFEWYFVLNATENTFLISVHFLCVSCRAFGLTWCSLFLV